MVRQMAWNRLWSRGSLSRWLQLVASKPVSSLLTTMQLQVHSSATRRAGRGRG
jgi:hypothetical protein